jgi:hypothetical protein
LRLRQTGPDLSNPLLDPGRVTTDERRSVAASPAAPQVPLGAILFPERATQSRPALDRLSPARAAIGLVGAPRIPGWRDERVIAGGFRHAARLARKVPAFAIRVPWENRSAESVRDLVLGALRAAAAEPASAQEANRA